MADTIKFKRGSSNLIGYIPAEGEPIYDKINHILKVGDGVNAWENLLGIDADTLDGKHAVAFPEKLIENIEVTVGNGGDFATINEALEYLINKYYPQYLSSGVVPKATIRLLSGFVMAERIYIDGLNLSWITITGDDGETTVLAVDLGNNGESGYAAFEVVNGGFLPIIDQLFNIDTTDATYDHDGIIVTHGSYVYIKSGAGFKNAYNGLYVQYASVAIARGAIFINCHHGIEVRQSSIADIEGAIVDNAIGNGIYAREGALVNAKSISAINAGIYGIYAQDGAIINAAIADATGAGDTGIKVYYGGSINAVGASGTLSQTANTLTKYGIIYQ